MSPFEKLDYIQKNFSSKSRIKITLSKERLDTDDISYQRPSVPIHSDFGFRKHPKSKQAPSTPKPVFQEAVLQATSTNLYAPTPLSQQPTKVAPKSKKPSKYGAAAVLSEFFQITPTSDVKEN